MKIIILGSGQIGTILAEFLLTEDNDITVVDNNELYLFRLQDRLDLRVVVGHAAYPEVLREAGAEEADILIAATHSDEINMIACQISYSFFSIPKKIASIQSIDYIKVENKIFSNNEEYINHFIHPEKMIIKYLISLVKYPTISKVIYLFDDIIVLSVIQVSDNSNLVGISISDIKNKISGIYFLIPVVIRNAIPFFSTSSTILKINDEFFLLCFSKYFLQLMQQLKYVTKKKNKNIILAGGGKIGFGLAHILEKKYNIKVIELNQKRAKKISRNLLNSTVFFGNASDVRLLSEENINNTDIFISITNNDEVNIISAIIAKKMGSKKVIALVNNKRYLELVNFSKNIDQIIFPQELIVSELLNYIRPPHIISKFFLQIGEIEVIEILVKRNKNTNFIIGSLLSEITFPPGAMLFTIIRYNNIIISNDNFDNVRIEEEDHLIVLLTNRISIRDIEKLF
ncbi:MAG TPA: Trk system potassium transporter TrkA [Buchnera sp. (in: enterobacteria)]|nr:Trk system potassium transporter TrkA [Buchnera sp. (in: enterobacteria)]